MAKKETLTVPAISGKVDARDGERFRHFLNMTAPQRERWCKIYVTPRALRTALDNDIRSKGGNA